MFLMVAEEDITICLFSHVSACVLYPPSKKTCIFGTPSTPKI